MSVTGVKRERLEILINALDVLPDEEFDFNHVIKRTDWGATCDGIGLAPRLFPDIVEEYINDFGYSSVRVKSDHSISKYAEVANYLFEINKDVAKYLFHPGSDHKVLHPYLDELGKDTKPKELAEQLRKFLQLIDSGELNPDGTKKEKQMEMEPGYREISLEEVLEKVKADDYNGVEYRFAVDEWYEISANQGWSLIDLTDAKFRIKEISDKDRLKEILKTGYVWDRNDACGRFVLMRSKKVDNGLIYVDQPANFYCSADYLLRNCESCSREKYFGFEE